MSNYLSVSFPLGTHDHIFVKMKLKRPIIFNAVRLFFPIQIIVLLSWASFWIDYRSVPARTSLGVTTVLTFVKVRMHIFTTDIPNGTDLNIYDIYSLICFLFVFMAFLEYAWAQSIDLQCGSQKEHWLIEVWDTYLLIFKSVFLNLEYVKSFYTISSMSILFSNHIKREETSKTRILARWWAYLVDCVPC